MIIETPSRLHFGIVNINNPNYPMYKCAGCALKDIKLIAEFEISDELILENFTRVDLIERLKQYASKFEKKIIFRILKEIPSHIGLGSTTQICLSFAFAINKVNNTYFDPYKEAKELKLGKISGIGIAAFICGGFIIDTGKINEIARIEFRNEFPEDWVFVLLRDLGMSKGLTEDIEYEVIKSLKPSPDERIKEMYSLLENMKDSIKDKDVETFGKTLTRFQYLVGLNFLEYQGGIFMNKKMEDLIEFLLKNGAYGAGQSSWGPTIYGLFQKDNLKINKLREKLPEDIEIKTVVADNYGFRIKKNIDKN